MSFTNVSSAVTSGMISNGEVNDTGVGMSVYNLHFSRVKSKY